ncbi:VCBS repeat-containing protein [Mucilaginibacter mali]|uniref:VCBS repeat-containing protein n=1 Tax=Mucilaginibacter mali TaxID=2740462 RepID=A0A7D4UCI8_9SPHI|nr:FG-GAP-like repeat-containing protein [Mucilaginibacter mali]QKJ29379.1 VCBS repeat-containing protein [Mucilaginibacter mali]
MVKPLLYYFLIFITFSGFAQAPVVNSFNPVAANVGATITISGANFNGSAAGNLVLFGTSKATVSAATANSLTVIVPAGATYDHISVLNSDNHLSGSSAAAFIPTFSTSNKGNKPALDPEFNITRAFGPLSVAAGDIDGDGRPDLVFTNSETNVISVMRNTATVGTLFNDASFAIKADFATGKQPSAVKLYDMDGDGRPDLVVNNIADRTISVFRNTAAPGNINTNSFAQRMDYPVGAMPLSFCIGDMDGDGKPDILVANQADNTVSFLRNASVPGGFTNASFSKTDLPVISSPASIATGDIDGDGKPDMVITNTVLGVGNDNNIAIYRNAGGNGVNTALFAPGFEMQYTEGAPVAVALADLDNDQKQDLLITTSYAKLIVYQNNATPGVLNAGSFAAPVGFNVQSSPPGAIAIGDMNGDGRPDVFLGAGRMYPPWLLTNTSTKGFIDAGSLLTDGYVTQYGSAVAIADMDGDHKPDMITVNPNNGVISIVRNITTDVPPVITGVIPSSAPVGSTITISGNNFNGDKDANTVTFGTVNAKILSANASQLQVTVPAGAAYQPISVTNTPAALTAFSRLPFNPTFSGKNSIAATDFDTPVEIPSGNSTYSFLANAFTFNDIDGDGKPDLLVEDGDKVLYIYPNIASAGKVTKASFGPPVSIQVASNSPITSINSADMNGDGKPDVLIGYDSGKILILLNNSRPGNFSFGAIAGYKNQDGNYYNLVADVDLDGKLDIGRLSPSTASLITNLILDYSYMSADPYKGRTVSNQGSPGGMAIADVDGDGRPDLIVTERDKAVVSVYQNVSDQPLYGNPNYNLAPKVSFATGTAPYAIKVADIDGDGNPDLVIASQSANEVYVLRNTAVKGSISASSFAPKAVYNTTAAGAALSIADIDGDGKPDIVVNTSAGISILRNQATAGTIGAASFAPHTDIAGTLAGRVEMVDVDGDGLPDIAGLNSTTKAIVIYRNDPLSATLQIKASTGKTIFNYASTSAPAPIIVDAGITVADAGNSKPRSGTISIANFVAGNDVLALISNPASMGDITAKFNTGNGVLSLSSVAGASIAQWQAALKAVTYVNRNTTNPDLSDRTIGFVLNNGAIGSNTETKTLGFINNSDARLSNLQLKFGNLTPAFNPDSLNYKFLIGSNASPMTITATAAVGSATIKVNNVVVASGTATNDLVLNTGDNTFSFVVTAADGITQRTYTVVFTKVAVAQALSVPATATVKYGTSYYQVDVAKTTSFQPVSYTSSNSDVATIDASGYVKVRGVGTTTITVSQTGSASVTQQFTVTPADLIVTPSNVSIAYLDKVPTAFSLNYLGFVNDDNQYQITDPPKATTTATANSVVGKYPITLSGGSARNYKLVYQAATLAITGPVINPLTTPVTLTLAANGSRSVQLSDLAKISNNSKGLSPPVSITPSVLNCATLGKQNITITSTDGNALNAGVAFNSPASIAMDAAGNYYVADAANYVIRKISTTGLVTTYAGNGYRGSADGPAATASFGYPVGLAVDAEGNVYVGDNWYKRLCKIDVNGMVTTIATYPTENIYSMTIDSRKNIYFIGDGSCVYKISATGVFSMLAGSNIHGTPYLGQGIAPDVSFDGINSVFVDEQDNVLVADRTRLLKIQPNNTVTTMLTFYSADKVMMDSQHNCYVYSYYSRALLKYKYPNAYGELLAGSGTPASEDGIGAGASVLNIISMVADRSGNVLAIEGNTHKIRKVTPDGVVSTFAGSGMAGFSNGDLSAGDNGRVFSMQVPVNVKSRLAINTVYNNITLTPDASGKVLMPDYASSANVGSSCPNAGIKVAQSVLAGTVLPPNTAVTVTITATDDTGAKDEKVFNVTATASPIQLTANTGPIVLKLDKATTSKKLVAADLVKANSPAAVFTFAPAVLDCSTLGPQTIKVSAASNAQGTPASVRFDRPYGITIDPAGNIYFTENNLSSVRKISTTGDVSTLAGGRGQGFANGTGTAALFNSPYGIATDAGGNVYVADYQNNSIRKITSTGVVTTLAGSQNWDNDGFGTLASIDMPYAVAVAPDGTVYAGGVNTNIRKITPEGVVTTIAGTGSVNATGTSLDLGVANAMICDKQGNVYTADRSNSRIIRITPSGQVSTYVANVISPTGLGFDSKGNLFISQSFNYTGRISKCDTNGNLSTFLDFLNPFSYISPSGLAIDASDNIYFTDTTNGRIIKVTPAGVMTSIGDSTAPLDGNIGNAMAATYASIDIPVTVLSTPAITSSYPNEHVIANSTGNALLPDYTVTATATNNCTNSKVTFTQTPAAGTVVPAGGQISVTLTATNVEGGTDQLTFPVSATYLSFSALPAKTYGAADFSPVVTASITGEITYTSSNTRVATFVNGKIHLVGAGTANITAIFNGSTSGSLTQTLQVNKAPLTIKANNVSRAYHADNPAFTFTYTGFVNNEDVNSLAAMPIATTTATYSSDPGGYFITPAGAVAANYTITYATGVLTVSLQPQITSILPAAAKPGATVVLSGININNATSVYFGDTPAASFTINGNGSISAVIGSGTSGTVSVTGPNGTATYPNYPVVQVPVITAGGPTTFFNGNSVVLTTSPVNGYAYQWFRDGSAITDATSASYTATQSGAYTVGVSINAITQTSVPIQVASVFSLPADNFKVSATSATCRGSANGAINITAKRSLAYTATITGGALNNSVSFTTTGLVDKLAAGTYNVCITVAGQPDYQKCYTLVISEPKDLSVYTAVTPDQHAINLTLTGGTTYYIQLNGVKSTVTDSILTLPLKAGTNHLIVTTDKACQGIIEKSVVVEDKVLPYPDPFGDTLSINLGFEQTSTATVEIYTLFGQRVYQQQFNTPGGTIRLDVSSIKNTGVYSLHLRTDAGTRIFKIFKK